MDSIAHLRFKEEVRHYLKLMREASATIIDQGVSKHPIFVFHKQELPLGIEISNPGSSSGGWYVSASTLEEFVAKQLVAEDKVKAFLKTYKDPEEHFCLFLVDGEIAEFVFIPQEMPGAN